MAPAWLIWPGGDLPRSFRFEIPPCLHEEQRILVCAKVDFKRQARYFLTLLYTIIKNTRQNDLPRSFVFEISPCQHEEKPFSNTSHACRCFLKSGPNGA